VEHERGPLGPVATLTAARYTVAPHVRALHAHVWKEIGFFYQGAGVFYVGDRAVPMRAGDVFVLDSGVPHRARPTGRRPLRMLFLYFDAAFLNRAGGGAAGVLDAFELAARYRVHHVPAAAPGAAAVRRLLRDAAAEATARPSDWEPAAAACVVRALVLTARAIRAQVGAAGLSPAPAGAAARFRPVLDHIEAHLGNPLYVDALAGLAALSPSRFRHAFKAAVGMPVTRYVRDARVARAQSLLRSTDWPVSAVARHVGFNSLAHFNRTFRAATNSAPLAYRQGWATGGER